MDEIEKLIFSLRNGKVQTRRDSAYLLGEKGDSRAIPALSQALEDNDTYVRERARDSLRQLTEYGKPIAEQKYEFVDVLTEFLEYSFLTRRVYMMLSGFLSSRHDEKNIFEYLKWLGTYLTTRYEEENKFDSVKSWLYNTSTIIIPFWLFSLLWSEFILGELGEVLGFIVLVSPPFLIYFAIKFMLKGYDDYTSIFLIGHILIIIFYILFTVLMMMPM